MLELGKYATEILASYAIGLGLLAGLIVQSVMRQRRVKAKIRAIEAARKVNQ